jgi:hypothetical protein
MWSVRLVVEDDDARPMSGACSWALSDDVPRISVGGPSPGEEDEQAHFTVELRASSADAAEDHAQALASRVRRAARLPDAVLPVAWVAPLLDDDVSSHRFLDEAITLLESEQFEMAVVAAHVHFELQVRTLLRRALERDVQRWAERLLKTRGVATLGNDQSLATVELLLGDDVTQAPAWPAFKAHLARRNGIVHEGQVVGRKEAAASIAVVRELWIRLSDAARQNKDESSVNPANAIEDVDERVDRRP